MLLQRGENAAHTFSKYIQRISGMKKSWQGSYQLNGSSCNFMQMSTIVAEDFNMDWDNRTINLSKLATAFAQWVLCSN